MRSSSVLKLSCIAAFLLTAALVQVVKSINVERYRDFLAAWSRQATGQPLEIKGHLSLRLSLSPAVLANDLLLPAPAGAAAPELLKIDHLEAKLALLPLLTGEVRVQGLRATGVHLLWEKHANGKGDWFVGQLLKSGPTPLAIPMTELKIEQVELEDVTVHYVDLQAGTDHVIHFDHLTAEAHGNADRVAFTATGEWGVEKAEARSFDTSGTLGSPKELLDSRKPLPVDMKLVLPGLIATANGVVGRDGDGIQSLNLSITVQSADIVESGRLVGMTLPPFGAARAAFTLSGSISAPSISNLDLIVGRHDMLAFSAKGMIADPLAFKGFDLAITADGENLPAFGRAFDLALPSLGSIRASAHLNELADGWSLSDVKATTRQDNLAGHFVLQWTNSHPQFEAEFESSRFDFGELLAESSDSLVGRPVVGHVFSERPLPLALLNEIDGKFQWKIGRLSLGSLLVEDVKIPLTIKDGRLQAAISVERLAGGKASMAMAVDSRQSPGLILASLSTEKVDAGPILQALGIAVSLEGAPTDLHFSLSGSGESTHAIMSHLAGEGVMSIGAGTFDSGAAQESTPWLNAGHVGLGCLYGHFTVEDGLAYTESFLLDLDTVTIGGRGSIQLGKEELDLALLPRPKDPNLAGLSVPLDVAGSLAHPLIVPARSAAVKGVAPAVLPTTSHTDGNLCQMAAVSGKPLHRPPHVIPKGLPD